MTITEQGSESVSLAPLFGENSMETWTRTLLEKRRCMDCKVEIEDLDGAMVFRGELPHVELVGHLCEVCRERREGIRLYRRSLTTR